MAITSFTEESPPHSPPMLRDPEPVADGDLLDLFIRQRDSFAFEELVRRHGSMVLGVCRRVLDNAHDAEDCFQAVFLVLVRKAATIQPRQMVGNWLYGVAYRTALEAKKMAARRRNREKKKSTMPRHETDTEFWNELRPVLDQELTRLPDKYRSILISCDLEGQTRKDVALALGLPEGTVASRLARARVMLAKRLSRRNLAISAGALARLLGERAARTAVPPALRASAIRAAASQSAGRPMEQAVSAQAAALADRVARSLGRGRALVGAAVLTAVALLALGIAALLPSALAHRAADPNLAVDKPKVEKPQQAFDCVLQKVDPARHIVHATLASEADGGTEIQAFHVEPATRILLDGKESELADLRAGMCVRLEWLTRADGDKLAQSIEVVGESVEGIVQALNEQSLTLRCESKGVIADKTYEFAKDGIVFVDGKKAKFDDLKAKMKVTIKAPLGKTKALGIKAAGPKVAGKVKAVNIDKRTLSLDAADPPLVAHAITIAPDAKVTVAGKHGTLADLKSGMRVTVQMSAEAERDCIVAIVAALMRDER